MVARISSVSSYGLGARRDGRERFSGGADVFAGCCGGVGFATGGVVAVGGVISGCGERCGPRALCRSALRACEPKIASSGGGVAWTIVIAGVGAPAPGRVPTPLAVCALAGAFFLARRSFARQSAQS